VKFYTGIPDRSHEPMWSGYWSNRVLALKRAGVDVTTRPLRYRDEYIPLPDGSEQLVSTPQGKGIDIRLALLDQTQHQSVASTEYSGSEWKRGFITLALTIGIIDRELNSQTETLPNVSAIGDFLNLLA
jgi:hypothetical protein